jgi:hypothetical protein
MLLQTILRRKSLRDFHLETHISIKNSYIYFQTTRCASSSIRQHLQTFEYLGTTDNVIDVNNRRLSPHIWPYQLTDVQLTEMLHGDAFFRFAFTRHPMTRLLSTYLYRILQPTASRTKLLGALNLSSEATISFSTFVDFICNQHDPVQMDNHWRPQVDCLCHGDISLHFIGKFENLVNDLLLAGKTIGASFDPVSIQTINVSPSPGNSIDHVATFFTPRIADLVRGRYSADFAAYGYSMDIPTRESVS